MTESPPLRFLADESCDFAVIRALRAAGHDVLSVAEYTSRSDDAELITQAYRERRILITEDKDFGWLVFVSQADSPGVILIRFPGSARASLPRLVLQLVADYSTKLPLSFVVLAPGQLRITPRTRS